MRINNSYKPQHINPPRIKESKVITVSFTGFLFLIKTKSNVAPAAATKKRLYKYTKQIEKNAKKPKQKAYDKGFRINIFSKRATNQINRTITNEREIPGSEILLAIKKEKSIAKNNKINSKV